MQRICCHERLFSGAARMSRPERRRGRGAAGLTELAGLLSQRDQAVLQAIAEHRYFTTKQVEQLLFSSHSTPDSGARCCRRVLSRLERWKLLERPIRRVGGLQAGSAASIWMLSSAGQRLRNLQAGRGAVGRVREPGERFIQHYLAIGDAHLALVTAARAGLVELLSVQIEPACWRPYTGLGGTREVLKPDLFAVTASGEYEDHWFIEIDRATESLPVLIRQCQLVRGLPAQRHRTSRLQACSPACCGWCPTSFAPLGCGRRWPVLGRSTVSCFRSLPPLS